MRACREHKRPRYSEMRKQHFAKLAKNQLIVFIRRKCHVFKRKSLHLRAIFIVALKRDERRPARCYTVSELPSHFIACSGRACERIRKSAGADNGGAAGYNSAVGLYAGDFAVFRNNMLCAFAYVTHSAALEIARERSGNVVCVVGHGKHAVAALGFKRKPERLEKLHCFSRREPVERTVQKPAVAGYVGKKIFYVAVVGHVAAALARYAQLAPERFVRLKQDNVKAALRSYKAAHHSGGSAADNNRVRT